MARSRKLNGPAPASKAVGGARRGPEKHNEPGVRFTAIHRAIGVQNALAEPTAPVAKATIERWLARSKARRVAIRRDPHDLAAIYVAEPASGPSLAEFRLMVAKALDEHNARPAAMLGDRPVDVWLRR